MSDTDRAQLLYENANELRTHQDNLHWTIAGSYVALFGASVTLFRKDSMPDLLEPYLVPGLFVVGNFFLLILAVESWYYNVFSTYVKDCEARFARQQPPRPLHDCTKDVAAKTTPFHPSFFFVLLFVACTNSVFLSLWLNKAHSSPALFWASIATYFVVLFLCCRYWNLLTYKLILRTLERLLSPK